MDVLSKPIIDIYLFILLLTIISNSQYYTLLQSTTPFFVLKMPRNQGLSSAWIFCYCIFVENCCKVSLTVCKQFNQYVLALQLNKTRERISIASKVMLKFTRWDNWWLMNRRKGSRIVRNPSRNADRKV